MTPPDANTGTRERRALAWVLFGVFLLQLHSWNSLEGYQLADSVEYMERARNLALGEEVRVEGAVRSFGFSLLLMPVFWVASWFGAESWPGLVWTGSAGPAQVGIAWASLRKIRIFQEYFYHEKHCPCTHGPRDGTHARIHAVPFTVLF